MTVILAAFLAYLLTVRTESAQPPVAAENLSSESPHAGINQFRYTQTQAGIVQWEVLAQQAHVLEIEKRALLDQVAVTLYGTRGWEVKLEGEKGTVNLVTKDFSLSNARDPILVHIQGGYTIASNHFIWRDRDRQIVTDDPVTISGNGLRVQGQGLTGRLDAEEFQVLRDVRVDIRQ